jgi:hypothetical protein
MPDMSGDTFVSQGIKYVLLNGPKGNLRPYTVGRIAAIARRGSRWLPRLGWAGLAIGTAALIGVAVWCVCSHVGQTSTPGRTDS